MKSIPAGGGNKSWPLPTNNNSPKPSDFAILGWGDNQSWHLPTKNNSPNPSDFAILGWGDNQSWHLPTNNNSPKPLVLAIISRNGDYVALTHKQRLALGQVATPSRSWMLLSVHAHAILPHLTRQHHQCHHQSHHLCTYLVSTPESFAES